MAPTQETTPERRFRLWPGVIAVSVQWLLWFVVPAVVPEATVMGFYSAMLGGVAVLVWWAFFSRVPHLERWGAVVLAFAAMAVTPRFLDTSVATAAMGMLFKLYAVPVLSAVLVGWALLGRRMAVWPRRAVLAAAILSACAIFTLFRTEGVMGNFRSQLAWRWTRSPEQRLLAEAASQPAPPPAPEPAPSQPKAGPAAAATPLPAPPAALTRTAGSAWPGFRGPHRDSVVTGTRIRTDWSVAPPKVLWRRAVGPGWSSMAVAGGLVYTQEQRGESEVVACYDAATGKPVWTHPDATRFYESNGGAGPRATPTVHEGRVYTFGATGLLNALDAATGAIVWKRNAAADTSEKVPGWGFSSSPLVVDDLVIVAASGRLAAYSLATGDQRWLGPDGGVSYASPHLVTIDGMSQVLLLAQPGVISVSSASGSVLWKHAWPAEFASLQPTAMDNGELLVTTSGAGAGLGVRRLAVTHSPEGWATRELWTSTGLKPYFNDLVVHKGHAFGFDGGILSSIDLADGKRTWKGGRYGYGQMILLADQDLLLVVTEEGELALVAATPDRFNEIARIPALEGKTWNHPAVSGDLLLVRNGQEMVAFRLPVAGS